MNGKITLSNKLKGAVTMANTIINGGASPYPKGASGDIITITDGAENTPLKSAVVNIEPVQSGSGDPSPTNIRPISGWTQVDGAVAGKNLWEFNSSYSQSGFGIVISNQVLDTPLRAGTYRLTVDGTISNALAVAFRRSDSTNITTATLSSSTKSVTVTLTETAVKLNAYANAAIDISNIQLELGSTASPYAAPTITPITISLGQTVYSGALDVVRGKLNAKPYYASYSGQTLVGPWISSHDKYVAGATPTTGAQVVDMGAAGTEYDLTPQTIKTLLGVNNIWADAGEMSIEYYPAAASIVAVQNRSTKAYVSIPLGMIRYETYQITPQQTIDLDSYRSENGNLLRNPVATKCKLEFNTPLMTDTQWGEIWNIIKAGFNNNTERKLKLKYYDTLSASYKTGYFYVPDVQTTIRNIEEGPGVINYQEIRLAFIEY